MFCKILQFVSIFIIFIACSVGLKAQNIKAEIEFLPKQFVRVKGKILRPETGQKSWSFAQNFADVSGLGERIENFRLFDENGQPINVKEFIRGEFEAEKPARIFTYDLNLKPLQQETSAAHVSWLTENQGLLMTGDLFSRNLGKMSAELSLIVPPNTQIFTSENDDGKNIFNVSAVEKAVFLIGKNIREKNFAVDKTNVSVAIVGERQFTDEDALKFTQEIFSEHLKTFGDAPFPKVRIFLLPFPQETNFERWRAETRGSTVTIISAPTTFKSNALNRLHEQLRHEIFHLWLPNAINLSGNYDWFYEGFTYYQALKTGVGLNQIRFADFLSTIARGADFSEILTRRQNFSLLEASEKRWSNAGEFIYAKGVVTAFLCDANLIVASKGKRDLEKIFREILQKHRFPNLREDGNTAILRILKQYPELHPMIEKYILGNAGLNLENDLREFGIVVKKVSGVTELTVTDKPNGRQKDLLDKLGYNQWRKLTRK